MAEGRDPRTREEWQEAVDSADALLHLDAARKYGFVTGGPRINLERCAEIVERGQAMGVTPSPGNVERFVAAYQQEHAPRRLKKRRGGKRGRQAGGV